MRSISAAEIREAFRHDFGREPLPGEIQQRVLHQIDLIKASNFHFV